MQRIIGCADHSSRTIRVAAAAERIRALAQQAEARTVPSVGVVGVVSIFIAAVLGLALATSDGDRRFRPTFIKGELAAFSSLS